MGVGDGEGQTGVVGRRGESSERKAEGQELGEGVKGEDIRDSWGEGKKGRGENPWIKKRPTGAGERYQPDSWQPSNAVR